MGSDYKKEFTKVYSHLNLWVKRIYITAFNIYAWYWLYREIFERHTTEFEPYLLWFFTTVGMHFFVLDNQDSLFKIKKK